MNITFRRFGRIILKNLSHAVLKKHQPLVIAVIGGPQTAVAREVIYTVLHQHFPTRRNIEAPEAEFAIPLTIFGVDNYPQNLFQWFKIIAKTLVQLVTIKPHFHILILEMNTQLSEILNYWLETTKPNFAIVCGPCPESHLINRETAFLIPDEVSLIKQLEPYHNVVRAIGIHLGIPKKEISKSLDTFKLPNPRLRVLPGESETLIVDATYRYFPPSQQSLEEILDPLPGRKVWIRRVPDWKRAQLNPGDVIIIIGPRKNLLEVVEQAARNPLESL